MPQEDQTTRRRSCCFYLGASFVCAVELAENGPVCTVGDTMSPAEQRTQVLPVGVRCGRLSQPGEVGDGTCGEPIYPTSQSGCDGSPRLLGRKRHCQHATLGIPYPAGRAAFSAAQAPDVPTMVTLDGMDGTLPPIVLPISHDSNRCLSRSVRLLFYPLCHHHASPSLDPEFSPLSQRSILDILLASASPLSRPLGA